MESSREAILQAVRRHAVAPLPAPERFAAGIQYADPWAQFTEVLRTVGGTFFQATDVQEVSQRLRENPAVASARTICSLVPGVLESTLQSEQIDDPHELERVDLAILPGEFCVAENAAVWFSGERVKHRVLPFICQHLALVVPDDQIVHNLHEAYTRLAFPQAGFGTFISGPSKTADIEQSLVIGAHGARSLHVVAMKR